ncbi:MAG: metallophosphoesterase [Deltaproteobacteria bacterium]|nr:metallophosphoesterase [Deltaproteobacteria bacterium]
MRIRVLSDLHLEFEPLFLPAAGAEVVVLAGDIAQDTGGLNWIEENCAGLPVVYVPGNHEFYGSEYFEALARLRRGAATAGVHFLENEAVEIGGLRFLGCTLWTDFNLYREVNFHAKCARRGISDFSSIRVREADAERFLSPKDVLNFFQQSKDWLRASLAESDPERTVVVTHSAPAWGSLARCYAGDSLTPFFIVDLENLIKKYQPRLWLHGHTHNSFDYKLGRTRIVCNPRGYAGENRGDFDLNKVVEI